MRSQLIRGEAAIDGFDLQGMNAQLGAKSAASGMLRHRLALVRLVDRGARTVAASWSNPAADSISGTNAMPAPTACKSPARCVFASMTAATSVSTDRKVVREPRGFDRVDSQHHRLAGSQPAADRCSRRLLLIRRYCVFEIDDDGVGTACKRLVEAFWSVPWDEQI